MGMMKSVDLICDEVIEDGGKNLLMDERAKVYIKSMMLQAIQETLDLLEDRITTREA